jgi:hypothetical protein
VARWIVVLVFGGATVGVVLACGSKAVGVGACRQIEEARCNRAPSCPGISLGSLNTPPGVNPVEECIQYYDIDCLHGLATGTSPTQAQLSACLAAINNGDDCAAVAEPQEAGACAWLVPPADIDASDAGVVAVLCSGPADGGTTGYLDPPSSWTYNFVPTDGGAGVVCASVASVNGGDPTCVSCTLAPSTNSEQCEVSLGTWTLALDPVTSIVDITETGGQSWTPQCN